METDETGDIVCSEDVETGCIQPPTSSEVDPSNSTTRTSIGTGKSAKRMKLDPVTKAVTALQAIVTANRVPRMDDIDSFCATMGAHLRKLPESMALESQSVILIYLTDQRQKVLLLQSSAVSENSVASGSTISSPHSD